MSSSMSTESASVSQQPEVLGRSREGMIAESLKNGEDVQKQFPSVDFKGAVVEPTVNLMFDIQVRGSDLVIWETPVHFHIYVAFKKYVDEAKQRRYNTLMAEMLKNTADPAFAERLLWEARECLIGYPDVLSQFDAIFITKRPIPVMISDLHEVLRTKKETVRRMSLQNQEQGNSTEAKS
ncbi:uncharacterized protein CTRU02_201196 [Colletotrichum truncatum]|uniref:Uncharacterized protein n=1 Tax=Colletotrichum truncatum TaxID=5467 RepID=A0ACC3ZGS5_COLTU